MRKNVLKQNEVIRLAAWVTNKKDAIESLTYKEIATIATRELSIHITDMNIKGIINSMPELKIKVKQPKSPNKLDRLREAVCSLYMKCGEPIPEDIGHLW